jgi:RNA polymerase sigma factor (sigma-70 family)
MSLNSQGDFELIIEQNKGILYKVANSYCRDSDDRNDLVQEMIIQLWRSFPSFDNTSKLSTWIYRVALNVAISFYRRDVKRKNVSVPLSDKIIEITPEVSPDETEEQIGQLQKFISGLNELDRALILLYLEEKNQKEIAEILGLSEANVSTKVGRIKEKLRAKFSLTGE